MDYDLDYIFMYKNSDTLSHDFFEFCLILVLPCFPSKSSLYVLAAYLYLKKMYSAIMLGNGDCETASTLRVSRRKLRKLLIYPSLVLGNSLHGLSNFLRKAKNFQC